MPEYELNLGRDITRRGWYINAPAFVQGYVEAMFFADIDTPDHDTHGATVSDITPQTWFAFVRDCGRFERRNQGLLANACIGRPNYSHKQAGRDFWLSRNGHGAGFFDREQLGDLADKLQRAAEQFGPVDVYAGDDGQLYQMGEE